MDSSPFRVVSRGREMDSSPFRVVGHCFEGDVDRAFQVLEDRESGVKLAPDEIRYILSSMAVRSDIALMILCGC